jgi:hypothetical protein
MVVEVILIATRRGNRRRHIVENLDNDYLVNLDYGFKKGGVYGFYGFN